MDGWGRRGPRRERHIGLGNVGTEPGNPDWTSASRWPSMSLLLRSCTWTHLAWFPHSRCMSCCSGRTASPRRQQRCCWVEGGRIRQTWRPGTKRSTSTECHRKAKTPNSSLHPFQYYILEFFCYFIEKSVLRFHAFFSKKFKIGIKKKDEKPVFWLLFFCRN